MEGEPRCFLVHIRLGQKQPERGRIAEAAPLIQDAIQKVSKGEFQLAYTSHDGTTMGFFVRTPMAGGSIRAALEGSSRAYEYFSEKEWDAARAKGERPKLESPLSNEDSILILELGPHFTGQGFSRAQTWLQHHLVVTK
jgi:hypothetical protein